MSTSDIIVTIFVISFLLIMTGGAFYVAYRLGGFGEKKFTPEERQQWRTAWRKGMLSKN